VLRLSEPVCNYLDVHEVLKYHHNPDLTFLTEEEQDLLQDSASTCPSGRLASRLLSFLAKKKESDFRKFIACVNRASEHRGHKELLKCFQAKLDDEEWLSIEELISGSITPLSSPYVTPQNSPATRHIVISPEKPMPLIVLEGRLVEEDILEMDWKLWLSFSRGRYDDLEDLVGRMHDEYGEDSIDCEVVALWFQSLILMHRHKNYNGALRVLEGAMDLAMTSDCVNKRILVGRILQRRAQIFLMKGQKRVGARYFREAKEQLQFVGRGYDKTNMYCREAKMLSATEPHRRIDIEKMYQSALYALEKDDPYFLASYPSVTLSKAAFHLHLAFGSKLTPRDKLPLVTSDDIQKARETLSSFNEEEHILIDMRRFEYDLLQAELCWVEEKMEEARSRFTILKRAAEDSQVGNIASIAGHRLKCIPQSSAKPVQPVKTCSQ
jgi:hypothetical protein